MVQVREQQQVARLLADALLLLAERARFEPRSDAAIDILLATAPVAIARRCGQLISDRTLTGESRASALTRPDAIGLLARLSAATRRASQADNPEH